MTNSPSKVSLGEIRSTQQGFSQLAALAAVLDRYVIDVVEVDFSACTWFDANMSAPLGVVFAHAVDNLNDLKLRGLRQGVETILEKNRFLVGFGFPEQEDIHGTTIPYRRFSATDDRYFAAYLNRHLRRKGLPIMSEALSERFKIREFIAMNKGRIQIVSDRGYWEFSPRGETLARIDTPFPGTVINIEINTADTSSYRLRSEAEI